MNDWNTILDSAKRALKPRSLASVTEIAQTGTGAFGVLVSTLISLRTRDQVTLPKSRELLSIAPTPQAMVLLKEETIASSIYPAAFFRVKAKNLLAISQQIIQNHSGRVPHTLDDLLKLPGVGRKTATLVLGLGFGIPAICVDIHVHRITNRMGLVHTPDPDKTEQALMKIVPQDLWIQLNDTLVLFGQQLCTPQSPFCTQCPFQTWCPKNGVKKSR